HRQEETMPNDNSRREILKLMGVGGVVFASGLAGGRARGADDPRKRFDRGSAGAAGDFFFLQLSDTHWGYSGVANPQADVTLEKTIDTINRAGARPDFIVFTGDLTHNTDDDGVRRRRMAEFKKLASRLDVKTLRFMPGEHDAAKDRGRAYQDLFG